jgi:hypothetical protein
MEALLLAVLGRVLPAYHLVHLGEFAPHLLVLHDLPVLAVGLAEQVREDVLLEFELVLLGEHVPIVDLQVVEVEALEEGLEQLQVAHQDVHDVRLRRQELVGRQGTDALPELGWTGLGQDLVDHYVETVPSLAERGLLGSRYREGFGFGLLHNGRIV